MAPNKKDSIPCATANVQFDTLLFQRHCGLIKLVANNTYALIRHFNVSVLDMIM